MNELIENNEVRAEALERYIANHNYGDIIFHSDIEKIIDTSKKTNRYTTTIAKTKQLLLKNHQMAIESIPGQGYRLVSPDDFTDYSLGYYKRGINTMKRGKEFLTNAPTHNMSKEALETYRRVNDRAIRLEAAMAGVAVELKTLARRPHPFSIEVQNNED